MKGYVTRPKYMDYAYMVLGTGLVAAAVQNIYQPNNLVVGGFSGIAIIVQALTKGVMEGGIPLWLTNALLNIPVFLIAWRIKGAKFIGRTLICTVLLSGWLYILPSYSLIEDNLFLAAIFGGVVHGAGMGFVFLTKSTTGGTDMVGAIIQHYVKHLSVPRLMMCVDAIVVAGGAYVFGVEAALYAVVAIVVINRMADMLIDGTKHAKSVYIISDKHEEVAEAIMFEVNRGLTGIYAKGMYSKEEKMILYCVVNKKELVQIKEKVGQIDPHAFVIVGDAREAMGEGFLPVE